MSKIDTCNKYSLLSSDWLSFFGICSLLLDWHATRCYNTSPYKHFGSFSTYTLTLADHECTGDWECVVSANIELTSYANARHKADHDQEKKWKLENHSDLCCFESLSNVQVTGWLINHVHICFLCGYNCNGKSLQFSSYKIHIALRLENSQWKVTDFSRYLSNIFHDWSEVIISPHHTTVRFPLCTRACLILRSTGDKVWIAHLTDQIFRRVIVLFCEARYIFISCDGIKQCAEI